MKPRPSIIDIKIDSYGEWLKGLHLEDLKDFGEVIYRSKESLRLLYKIYRDKQIEFKGLKWKLNIN